MEQKLLTLTEVAQSLPSRPALSTIWRWILKGIGDVKLDARRYGRVWMVTPESLDTFAQRLAEQSRERLDKPQAPPKPKKQSPAKRARQIAQAKDALRREGVLK